MTNRRLIDTFSDYIHARLEAHFQQTPLKQVPEFHRELKLFMQAQPGLQQLTEPEGIILLLALMPHIMPNFFEQIIRKHLPGGGDFPEFGGVKATSHRSMLPTGETAQFILAGVDVNHRCIVQEILSTGRTLTDEGITWLEAVREGEPVMSGRLILAREWVERLLLGRESPPSFGPEFPAKRIVTAMDWGDAVLMPETMQQITDIAHWLAYQDKVHKDANLKRKVRPGYRVLFYGPPGTGKTLTAMLLGKQFQKDVYRIDLSQVVSKYIGETEKNLELIFRKAERKDWILFFDEADALFGKRTQTSSSHDRYANQEVSYLLQRVDDYPGLLVLASNFRNNMDDAFIRRFHSIVHFPAPGVRERLQLWEKSLPHDLPLAAEVNLKELADRFEMTGAGILNAIHFAVLQCYATSAETLGRNAIMDGIRREFIKEEKSF